MSANDTTAPFSSDASPSPTAGSYPGADARTRTFPAAHGRAYCPVPFSVENGIAAPSAPPSPRGSIVRTTPGPEIGARVTASTTTPLTDFAHATAAMCVMCLGCAGLALRRRRARLAQRRARIVGEFAADSRV